MRREEKRRNPAIDIFRIFCAIGIVAIHTKLFSDIDTTTGYWIKHVFTRIAVPFFCCIMGYYYAKKLDSGDKPLKKTVIKLLKMYIFWSIVYVIFNLIKSKIYHWDEVGGVAWIAKNVWSGFTNFFTLGTNTYHLWFFPFVIYSILIFDYAHKHNKVRGLLITSFILYIIAVLGSAYPQIASRVPVLRGLITWGLYDQAIRHFFANAFGFFCLGAALSRLKGIVRKNQWKDYVLEIILIALFIAENIYIAIFQKPAYQSVTFSLYPLVFQTTKILLNFSPKGTSRTHKIAKWTKPIADYMYFSHILWMDIVTLIMTKGFKMKGTEYTIIFFFTIAVTIITGSILYHFRDNKFIKDHIL